MTRDEFKKILLDIRKAVLSVMRRQGFFYGEKKRFDPTPWDINNGACDEFADMVVRVVRELFPKEPIEAYDLRELGADKEIAHIAVHWRGNFYDAECLSGVKDWRRLPIIQNEGLSRSTALKRGWKCPE